MDNSRKRDVREYIRILLDRKFHLIIPATIIFLIAILTSHFLPKIYRASTLVRIQSAEIRSRPYRETTEPISERLKTIKEEISSFNQLRAVVSELGLDVEYQDFPDEEKMIAIENLVNAIKKKLVINTRGTLQSIDIIEISLDGTDPERVRDIVNTITQRYIDKNMKQKQQQLYATVDFLEKKVKEYEKKLTESSEALKKFRQEHLEELGGTEETAGREGSYLAELNRLKSQLNDTIIEIQSKEKQKEEIAKQLSAEGEVFEKVRATFLEAKKQKLQTELEVLLVKFTQDHPKVKAIRKELAQIESQMQQKEGEEIVHSEMIGETTIQNYLKQELLAIEKDFISLKSSKAVIEKLIETEKERLKVVPDLLAQTKKLTEEDNSNRKMRDRYIQELATAKFAYEVEADQKGTKFEILELARKPLYPIKPSKFKLAFLGLLLGSGLGLGIVLLAEHSDDSFKNVEDVADFLKVPILGTIPVILTKKDKIRIRRKRRIGWFFVAACIVCICVILVALLRNFLLWR